MSKVPIISGYVVLMAILPTDIGILFTIYDIITYFLNLASCSEHFISIKLHNKLEEKKQTQPF
jgi:hypothetical protein